MTTCKHFTPDTHTSRDKLGKCQKITDYLQKGATIAQAENVAKTQLNGAYRTVHFTFLFVEDECCESRGCAKFEASE